MSTFQSFSKLVHTRYTQLAKHELFVVGVDNHDFSAAYLAAFPAGTNPVFVTNTEHDCSCCKNFIRNLGNLVAIIDGKVETVWGIQGAPYPYDVVAASMNDFVRAQPIVHIFRTTEVSYGAESTVQGLPDGTAKRWNHFHGAVDKKHLTKEPGTAIGGYNASVQVLRRGLEEITPEILTTVVDLIEANALYRGAEHLPSIQAFQKARNAWGKLDAAGKELFVWANAAAPYARFRNTVIGTLMTDLAEGKDLEYAVKGFETKVAPTNYKRPTALITPKMIKTAMATIAKLGLEPALERRFARISDVSVNNVLWVDNGVQSKMKDGLENLLMGAVAAPTKDLKAEEITIDEFMRTVLPTASSLQLLISGAHQGNFMSLTAPMHTDSGKLFKWSNDFGWSYDGNITDSIKEKVKAAGGNVTNAKLRISLAWFNYDDLDIWITEPSGNEICYYNKSGKQDVDMNAGGQRSRTPVENVSWTTTMNGVYDVRVNQFSRRETSDVGCVIEIENQGKIVQLSHPGALSGEVPFAKVTVAHGVVTNIEPAKGILSQGISQEKWGVSTETFVKVNTLMLSPNYWDDNAVGNKHWFFVLDGCKNENPTRGIYNEFLSSGLEAHRKVFEVLGDKTKCQPTDDQLSGLGFSSTRGDVVTVKVAGPKINKAFSITF